LWRKTEEPSIEMSQEDQLTEQEDSRQRSIIANDEYRTKRDQNLDEDFIPGSSDEDSSDGSPSSNKCELKKGKEPKKITVVEKKRPATDQSLAEDFIPGSTDEEDIDGNLSSTKSDVKRGKKPEKMARIEKKQPTKGRYTPQLIYFDNVLLFGGHSESSILNSHQFLTTLPIVSFPSFRGISSKCMYFKVSILPRYWILLLISLFSKYEIVNT